MASADVRRRLYLIQELDVSVLAIEAGLAELQSSRPYRPGHFAFLLLLATGVERLAKVVLHLRALDTTGDFLAPGTVKKYSHDLVGLVGEVVDQCFMPAYLARPVAVQDRDFIVSDATFGAILALLSDFARNDRYVYMDGISEPDGTAEPPPRRWDELEAGTMPPGEHARLYVAGEEDRAKRHANRVLVAHIERFVRAVARLFVLGALGDLARQVSSEVSRFARLDDDQLGETVYRA